MTTIKCQNCNEEQDHICTYCGTDVVTITSMGSRPEPEGYGFYDLFKSFIHEAVYEAITKYIEDFETWGDAPIDNLTALCFKAANQAIANMKETEEEFAVAYNAACTVCEQFNTEEAVFIECQKLYN